MERSSTTKLRIGDWDVDPESGQISCGAETVRLETRTMRLLLCLAERAGEVVSIDDLLNHVWSGVNVSQDSVYQAVASLRRLFGDDARQPTYIATVPRLGYRLVARVALSTDPSFTQTSSPDRQSEESGTSAPDAPMPVVRRASSRWIGAAACLALGIASLAYLFHGQSAKGRPASATITLQQPLRSIAVLPFLDLTEKMTEEPFADGMTEELIDKLSKIPGLQVPAPTASFYFKNKQIPIAEIAKSLAVSYVLDGSVRKSGPRLRVAARLVRADNGYIVWSETYDRPFKDILTIQDDIAGEVTKALKTSIAVNAGPR